MGLIKLPIFVHKLLKQLCLLSCKFNNCIINWTTIFKEMLLKQSCKEPYDLLYVWPKVCQTRYSLFSLRNSTVFFLGLKEYLLSILFLSPSHTFTMTWMICLLRNWWKSIELLSFTLNSILVLVLVWIGRKISVFVGMIFISSYFSGRSSQKHLKLT